MARWQLLEDHYINVYPPRFGPTEWEYKEVDQATGREMRTRFPVPTYVEKGAIVATKGSEQQGDLVWTNEVQPTCNMRPLDDEAAAYDIAQPFGWDPLDDLPTQGGFADKLISGLERQMAELVARLPASGPAEAAGVSKAEFEELKAQLAQLLAEKAEREKPTPRRSLQHG